MVSQKVKINNPAGLHVQPAGRLCQVAMEFQSKITFQTKNGNISNAKSLLSVLGASVRCGEELEFVCEGADEESALQRIIALVNSDFEQ